MVASAREQIVGPEPRAATFASSLVRLSCSVAPWPGELDVMLLLLSQRNRFLNAAITLVVCFVGLGNAQQPQSPSALDDQGKVFRDAGFLFYMYNKSVGTKELNESLDAMAIVLRQNPNLMAYLISYGAGKRASSFKKRLTTRGKIAPSRVRIIYGRNCSPWQIDLMKWSAAAEKPGATGGCLSGKSTTR